MNFFQSTDGVDRVSARRLADLQRSNITPYTLDVHRGIKKVERLYKYIRRKTRFILVCRLENVGEFSRGHEVLSSAVNFIRVKRKKKI